ncbi:Ferredoxin-3 [Caloramator mitchellensis]|uniref:Ferredoxin-3 n=1 Tax=Caloramator mitchellensis TaxID=908809 RepID=A0A0R3JSD1_CALMK|nr:4Fe-4S binding protein [Caloramator mitchellensis]KRQ86385.1 Ferredoxin-3 [Caloramator mitchellensis]
MGLSYLKNVAKIKIDEKECVGCGICKIVCPHRVIDIVDGTAILKDKDACIECGACASNCPTRAITVDTGVG